MERRRFLRTALAASLSAIAGKAVGAARQAVAPPDPAGGGTPSWPPAESFAVWPNRPPGSRATSPTYQLKKAGAAGGQLLQLRGIAEPRLNIFRPEKPDGRVILACPGGGYEFLSVENEGLDTARRFTPMGITVAVLTYRLPAEGWDDAADVPLQDAQRAMRVLRARASTLGIDPQRIAVMGFSAGGHLAASLMVDHDQEVYERVDAADRLSARPNVAALIYPVIGMDLATTHKGSRDHLLGASPSPELVLRRTPSRQVKAGAPPCFLVHALDDEVVSPQNSLDMLSACRSAHVPAEAHLFEKGGHGFGFGLPPTLSGSLWPDLFARWAHDRL